MAKWLNNLTTKPSNHYQHGFTMIEMILYVAITGFIGGILINFIFALSASFSHARAQKEVAANTRIAMDKMLSDIRYAGSVYTPTSVLDTNPGQLSMATYRNTPEGHLITYFDYYVSSSRLYFKREDQEHMAITNEKVKVTDLTFHYFKNGTGTAESVKIDLTVEYDAPPDKTALRASTSITATAAVRGAY